MTPPEAIIEPDLPIIDPHHHLWDLRALLGSFPEPLHPFLETVGLSAHYTFDQFLAEQFGYFLGRLHSTPEGDGTLLDHTVVLYGSSNSRTHQNRNYPLVLAGGSKLGLKHGHYRRYGNDVPLSNLFVTMLDRIGVPLEGFSDSTAEMSDLLA